MPFGENCEFEDFDACVATMQDDGRSQDEAERICGNLQSDTEDQCRNGNRSMAGTATSEDLRSSGHVRQFPTGRVAVRQTTLDEANRSIEAVITTEKVVRAFDLERFAVVDEVLLAEGGEFPDQLPLLEAHPEADRFRILLTDQLGSARSFRREGSEWIGRVFFASGAPDGTQESPEDRAWRLAQQGHLTDVSPGYRVEEAQIIEAGSSGTVNGRQFRAEARDLRVATRWKVFELSITPLGADMETKFRQLVGGMGRQVQHSGGRPPRNPFGETLQKLIARQACETYARDAVIRDLSGAAGRNAGDLLNSIPESVTAPMLNRMAVVLDCPTEQLINAAVEAGVKLQPAIGGDHESSAA